MPLKVKILKGEFRDSVVLMRISNRIKALDGVEESAVLMATDLNKQYLKEVGLYTPEIDAAGPNDLVIAVKGVNIDEALSTAMEALAGMREEAEAYYPTLSSALEEFKANLAVISVPGEYASMVAEEALSRGLNVFLFSSGVPVEEEVRLKRLAQERGLLLMGPDCGTAILDGYAIGFGNKVPRGDIGIVSAAGTGLQEVSTLIALMGGGISQAYGTGGRDLHEEVGGITMAQCIKLLAEDPQTKAIVLISKPPSKAALEKIVKETQRTSKPVIACFIGAKNVGDRIIYVETLEGAAIKALEAVGSGRVELLGLNREEYESLARLEYEKLSPGQRYIRGLYSGGTLAHEAIYLMEKHGFKVYSNIHPDTDYRLDNPWESKEHTIIDMGTEEFVLGRPHPMIDPTLRTRRIVQEASDSSVAVILLDVILGYGAHPDPADEIARAVAEARKKAEAEKRYLAFVAHVCGTQQDPQDLDEQVRKLEKEGVIVIPSNAQAVKMSMLIAGKGGIGGE